VSGDTSSANGTRTSRRSTAARPPRASRSVTLYAMEYDAASTMGMESSAVSTRRCVWPPTMRSTGSVSASAISRISPRQPVEASAGAVPACSQLAPTCAVTTTKSAPAARASRAAWSMAGASAPNSSPAVRPTSTISGVVRSAMPMTAVRTPPRSIITHGRTHSGCRRVPATNTLAASQGKRLSRTRAISVSCPQSNSWLPRAAAS
jgi:hypothetical protein